MSDSPITTIEKLSDLVVVHVQADRLDEKQLSTVRADTLAAGTESPRLTVALDLIKVTFMPSLALGGLIQVAQVFKARGQRLVLTGLHPLVRETMAITRLDRMFEIHNDLSTV